MARHEPFSKIVVFIWWVTAFAIPSTCLTVL